jgi:hypothetical protein
MRAGALRDLFGATLLLATGCIGGKGFAPDVLPKVTPDQRHPPDGMVILRPNASRPETAIRLGYLQAAPALDFVALGLALALKPHGSFNTIRNPERLCGPAPCSLPPLWIP